jgi:3-phosphoshikimate 1-carboxyvinyltransferase
MAPLHDALSTLGVLVEPLGEPGHLPVRITGGGAVTADALQLRGDVSSQYLSALMMIAPYLPHGLRIELTSPLVSEPYVALTAEVMAAFGHAAVSVGPGLVDVRPGGYEGRAFAVEADASSATYPLAAAAAVGGRVRVEGLGSGSSQADARFADVLAQMGCRVERTDEWTEVVRDAPLVGVDADLGDFSDSAPTLATLAALASGPSRVTGIGFIRAKESDRIGDVVRELQRCGADAEADDDGFTVRPSPLHGVLVHTYHDHRIAMAFAVMGLVVPGVEIDAPEVVSKSFPGFWQLLDQLSH